MLKEAICFKNLSTSAFKQQKSRQIRETLCLRTDRFVTNEKTLRQIESRIYREIRKTLIAKRKKVKSTIVNLNPPVARLVGIYVCYPGRE